MHFQIAGKSIIQIASQSDKMYRFNHTFRSKSKESHSSEREMSAESCSFNRDECHKECCNFSAPFSCRRNQDFQQKKKGQLKDQLSAILSLKLKERISFVEKGVHKENLSALLSPQRNENLSGKQKGNINLELSAPLSDGLKEILSQLLKVAQKGALSVTPWGAPQGVSTGATKAAPTGTPQVEPHCDSHSI
jgi:hypothetical protein